MIPHIVTDQSISVFLGGKPHTIPTSHPNFSTIKDKIRDQLWDQIENLIDIPQAIRVYGGGKVEVVDGQVLYLNAPLHNVLTERMLVMMNDGFNIQPLVHFLENLLENPSSQAVDELYLFLENGRLPITEDGHFLAYKIVGPEYLSIHANPDGSHEPHQIGAKPSMPRNRVDDRRQNTCSTGFHFCSEGYLPHYGSYRPGQEGDHVMILKINPRDVVSIPHDYNNAKGRACTYEVIGELEYQFTKADMEQSVWVEPPESEGTLTDDLGWGDDPSRQYQATFIALTEHAPIRSVVGTALFYADSDYEAEEMADEKDVSNIRWEQDAVSWRDIDPDTIRVRDIEQV